MLHEFETRMRIEGSDEIVMASAFREVANQAELSAQIDRQMLNNLEEWLTSHPNDRHELIIPLSYQSFDNQEVMQKIQDLLDQGSLDERRLVLGFHLEEVAEHLRELQRLTNRFAVRGVRFALLDAAPDQRIEMILKNVLVQFIKLGGDITAALRNDEQGRRALEELAARAERKDIRIIAPPVEATTDLATLWQFGITLVQGLSLIHISEPTRPY